MQPTTATLQAFNPSSTVETTLVSFGNVSDIELIQEQGKLFSIGVPLQEVMQETIPASQQGQDDGESSQQNILDGSEIAAPLVTDTSFSNQENTLLGETQEANFMANSTALPVIPTTFTIDDLDLDLIVTRPIQPVITPIPSARTINIGGITIVISPFSVSEVNRQQVHQAVDILFAAVKSENQGELLNNPVVRFANQNVPGTHFYSASVDEITNVILDYPQFQLDGVAFLVGIEPGDNLLAVHRFSNQSVPGTHFYTASQAEYQNVLANYPQFKYDGIAYYVADPAMNLGADVYRFSNQQIPGTHFYTASQAEYQNVLANYPQFHYDGIAYEVNIL